MTGHGEDFDQIVAEEVGDAPKPLPPSLSSQLKQSDPFFTGVALLFALVAAGFVLIFLGKRSIARTLNVAYQMPGLISGCIGGLALITVGVALAVILHGKRVEAGLRAETDDAVAAAIALVAVAKARRTRAAARPAEPARAGHDDATTSLPAVEATGALPAVPTPRRRQAATPARPSATRTRPSAAGRPGPTAPRAKATR